MQPLGSTVRHSTALSSVHVATLEAPLESLPPELTPEPERQEFGQHGLRQSEAAALEAANETPAEVPDPSPASVPPLSLTFCWIIM